MNDGALLVCVDFRASVRLCTVRGILLFWRGVVDPLGWGGRWAVVSGPGRVDRHTIAGGFMARHKVTVQDASIVELASPKRWYDLAGATSTDINGFVAGAQRAHQAGFLSAAAGPDFDGRLAALGGVARQDWHWACTLVLSLRVDGETAGMLVAGAHQQLWKLWGEHVYGPVATTDAPREVSERSEAAFLATILTTAKLHMVAVDPNQRGHGHGRRLINAAVDRLVKGGTVMIYGQFTGDRDLTTYYRSLGFDVLAKGARLNMALATGSRDSWIAPQPNETMFVRTFGPPRARRR